MANFYPPGFEHEKKNLAIDFDGVIHNADKGWGDGTCYGDPLPGSLEALNVTYLKNIILLYLLLKLNPIDLLVNGKTGSKLV
jgi:hypothetical protein